jgi:tRNA(Ile)-lysidine synthase
LLERWPQAGLLANRMAGHMLEAEQLLDEVAAGDLADCDDLERIGVERLRGLSSARRDNALRYAIRALGLPVPTAVQLTELGQALSARADAAPRVAWPGAEARVYRQHLYLGVPMQLRGSEARELAVGTTAMLGQGELRLVAAPGYGVPDRWAREGLSIRYRAGGERFRPHASRHHTSLKHWFQDAGIVPWMRQHVPLLYHGDRLVAVADLCLADDLPQSAADAPFWHPVWTGHERLR